MKNENEKFLIDSQFAAWSAKRCSVAPLTDYANNGKYRELPRRKNIYDSSISDESLYIFLRRIQGYTGKLEKIKINDSNLTLTVTLKDATPKKMSS